MSNRSDVLLRRLSSTFLLVSVLSTLSYAVTDRIAGPLNAGQNVTLSGNVHRQALPKYDQGRVDPSLQMNNMMLLTSPTASQRQALKTLVAEQQDPKSKNYHKWLTPEQWAERFGLSRGDVQKITDWLKAQGFKVGYVAKGRNWVTFSGTAGQVQSAFGTEIHRFNVNGEKHVANATSPKIPAALAGIVVAVQGLDDFHMKPKSAKMRPYYYDAALPLPNVMAPGDIATMYDLKGLYAAAIDGTGQRLAIIGQTDIFISDINDFRNAFGLTPITGCTIDSTSGLLTVCNTSNFKYVLVLGQGVSDPLLPSINDLSEADLDIEWSGAVARNAQIVYVNAPANSTGGGAYLAWHYAVDNNVAPVISLSYGTCEFHYNYDVSSTDEVELQKANSQGITFINASGDSGAAECDPNGIDTSGFSATGGWAVNYPASSPEVTAVGGTGIPLANVNNPTYWGTTNGTDGGSLLSYVPEQAWNDDSEFAQDCAANPTQYCTQGGATPFPGWVSVTNAQIAQEDLSLGTTTGIRSSGGGPSTCAVQNSGFSTCVSGFSQPSWQTVTVPNQAGARFTPDVSMLASANYPGYVICVAQEGWGGTGTASTCVNGISGSTGALELYTSVIGGTSVSTPVFAGVVTLLNQYLSSSGLGNMNPTLYQLAAASPSNGAFHQITTGTNLVYCTAGDPTNLPAAFQCPSSGASAGVLGFDSANFDTKNGYNLVTGLGSVDAANLLAAWAGASPGYSLSATALSPASVAAGSSATSTVTLTLQTSFSGTVTFGCSGLPTGASCSFNPSTANTSGNTALTVSTSATTPAATSSITVTGTTSTGVTSSTTVSLTVSAATFTLTPPASAVTVAQGSAVDVTVAFGGFSAPVTFTCTEPATLTESVCSAPAAAQAAGNVSFHITTTAPSFASNLNSDRDARMFYAVLLPGLLGIMFTVGSRKRATRGIRLLGLIMVLGVSTMWLGSCGGSSNQTQKNPGTPKGNYTVTVGGKSGATTVTNTFTLTVQ